MLTKFFSKINFIANTNRYLIILGTLFFLIFSFLHSYEVEFQGVKDETTLKLIRSASQLEKLKNSPPATLIGLKRRAEADVTNIISALHSLAYYDAKVETQIKNEGNLVQISIQEGIRYPFGDFIIHYTLNGDKCSPPVEIPLDKLKIHLKEPALPEAILNAEDILLDELNLHGYAFASISKKDVIVDQDKHAVTVVFDVETGPLTYFGPLTISGQDRVLKSFFYKKLRWQEGDIYDPKKVQKTQEALELSGLFKSVNITHTEQNRNSNVIPFRMDVVEAKQRSIGFGVSYNTWLGAGVMSEWEDRNVFGEGQKLSFRAEIWQIRQEGKLTYVIPEYKDRNQNLIWTLDYHHDTIKAFTDSTLSISAILERKLTKNLRVSYGGMYKLIRSEDSTFNGTFDLIQIPLQVRWNNIDNLFEPTEGFNLSLKSTPSLQFVAPTFAYCSNLFTGSYYQPLTKNKRHILAMKLMVGSIFGASQYDIPPPERFYAGSENALRGYKYLTVSPLNEKHKPIGGRSLFIYSLELRNRVGKNFGLVAFYEIGNVFKNPYPNFDEQWLQSAGLGFRYYTPIGPLRLDVAIPLNRRHHVDGPFQIYFSIGQAF